MVCVVLAGSLYHLDHGEHPARLELLVPDYLAALPEDPFDERRSRSPRSVRRDRLGPIQVRRRGRNPFGGTPHTGPGNRVLGLNWPGARPVRCAGPAAVELSF
jgi:hypothetical protein